MSDECFTENLEQQNDEIFAVDAIYPDLVKINERTRPRTIKVCLGSDVEIEFSLVETYPMQSPPKHRVSVPAFMVEVQNQIIDKLKQNYHEFERCPVICQCIVDAQEIIQNFKERSESTVSEQQREDEIDIKDIEDIKSQKMKSDFGGNQKKFEFMSGECLEDRKSVFQAHIVNINSKDEAMAALSQLCENTKIARATHNMYAYVIKLPNGLELSDCEDDGEKAAGPKLLHMLKLMQLENQMIIVTRWYGGIHLGPDRFRHICNVAREILNEYRSKHPNTTIDKRNK